MNNRADYLKEIRENGKKFQQDISGQCSERIACVVDFLVEERKKQGLSQQDIADAAGMKAPNITRIETMHSRPSLEILMRYAAALGYDIDIKVRRKE